MRLHRILLGMAAIQAALLAADFWTSLEPAKWSEGQTRIMVTNSPWAKEASVSLKTNPNLLANSRAVTGSRSPGMEGPLERPDTGAGDARGRDLSAGLGTGPRIVVRWESAAPICEACAKDGMQRYLSSCTSRLLYLSDLGAKFVELARDFYIVSLSNYPNTTLGADRDAPQHSAAATTSLERLGGRLQQTSFLKLGTKSQIRASKVVALPAGRVLLVVLFFPRTASITIQDKEIQLESTDENMLLKARFDLQKMAYKGRLEL